MLANRSKIVRGAVLVLILALGAAHAAVGEQWLDPGPQFTAASATAQVTPPAAPDFSAKLFQVPGLISAAVGAQRLDPGPQFTALVANAASSRAAAQASAPDNLHCIALPGHGARLVGALVVASAPAICLIVHA